MNYCVIALCKFMLSIDWYKFCSVIHCCFKFYSCGCQSSVSLHWILKLCWLKKAVSSSFWCKFCNRFYVFIFHLEMYKSMASIHISTGNVFHSLPVAPDYNSIGCWKDSNDRAMKIKVVVSNDMTVAKCAQICRVNAFYWYW